MGAQTVRRWGLPLRGALPQPGLCYVTLPSAPLGPSVTRDPRESTDFGSLWLTGKDI